MRFDLITFLQTIKTDLTTSYPDYKVIFPQLDGIAHTNKTNLITVQTTDVSYIPIDDTDHIETFGQIEIYLVSQSPTVSSDKQSMLEYFYQQDYFTQSSEDFEIDGDGQKPLYTYRLLVEFKFYTD